MKKTLALTVLLAAFVVPVLADSASTPGAPPGWQLGGDVGSYAIGTQTLPGMAPGTQVAFLKAGDNANCGTYGALFQTINAEAYRGKKVQLSARLLTDGLTPRSMREAFRGFDLFLFVQGPSGGQVVYRGKDTQPEGGGRDWDRRRAVMEVPADAQQITFGFRLAGPKASGWIDQVRFAVVDNAVFVPPARIIARGNRNFSMYQSIHCPARRDFLAARGLADRDERAVVDGQKRAVTRDVLLALAR
jgi:hypothetical protein